MSNTNEPISGLAAAAAAADEVANVDETTNADAASDVATDEPKQAGTQTDPTFLDELADHLTPLNANISSDSLPEFTPGRIERDPISLGSYGYPLAAVGLIRSAVGSEKPSPSDAAYFYMLPPRSMYEETISKATAEWAQVIKHAGEEVRIRQPRLAVNSNNISGPLAVDLVKRLTGRGGTLEIPLWHSGIWITMRSPTEAELINLDMRISTRRSILGVNTAGMLLSASSSIFARELIEFALSLVTNTNVANRAQGLVDALYERIDIFDYSTLIGAVMACMYPNGFNWEIHCANTTCRHVDDVILNFRRAFRVDRTAINAAQRDHWVKNAKLATDEQIATYKNEFSLTDKRVFTMDNGIKIHLRKATLREYITATEAWVQSIENQNVESISNYATEQQRVEFINAMTQARFMRRYEHFVDFITIQNGDDETHVSDRDTISQILDTLSTADVVGIEFEQYVMDYIQASTVALFGYTSYPCKACGTVKDTQKSRLRTIVPLGVDRLFFTLMRSKIQAMANIATFADTAQ